MKARILDPQVKAYSSMDEKALSIAYLKEGDEINFGSPKKKAGKLWVPIVLSSGQQAYISGDTRLFVIREAALMQAKVDVFTEPSAESTIKYQLSRNAKFSIQRVIKGGSQDWVRIKDTNGNEGYVFGDTRIRLFQQKTKAMGKKNILTGVMWLLIGVVISFSKITVTSGGSFTVLGYGALLFGAVMLIYGLVQFFTSTT
ncbi:MAG: hypothetical protein C3F13_13940 [Anaerolineales bacterium]|nr:MAG: hypothetical protein C3F13_13940 [Anaerolineales bacterium]